MNCPNCAQPITPEDQAAAQAFNFSQGICAHSDNFTLGEGMAVHDLPACVGPPERQLLLKPTLNPVTCTVCLARNLAHQV